MAAGKRTFFFLFFFLVLLMQPVLTTGQQFHTMYGHAYYAAEEPAVDATVTLVYEDSGEYLTTTTDAKGFFSFQLANLPSGWEDGKTIHITVEGANGHTGWKAEESVVIDASATAQEISDMYLSPMLVANFSYAPSDPAVNETVVFTDSSISVDGIAIYNWTFGDGSGYAVDSEVTHAYNTSGTFTVTLTITDQVGRHDYLSKNVTVTEEPGQDDEEDESGSIPAFCLPVALAAILIIVVRKRTEFT